MVLAAAIATSGCVFSNYLADMFRIRKAFEIGDYDTALRDLDGMAQSGRNDRLVFLMEAGLVAHTGGHYAKSTRRLQRAKNIMLGFESRAVLSVRDAGAAGASLLINEKVLPYRGEEFEKVLVHTYIAMNHMALARWDDAFVEMKQAYERQLVMAANSRSRPQVLGLPTYLWGLALEMTGDDNNAAVQYKTLAAAKPECLQAKETAISCLTRLGRGSDDYLRQMAPELLDMPSERIERARSRASSGELVLIFQCGTSPEKRSAELFLPVTPPIRVSVPFYVSTYNPIDYAVIRSAGQEVKTELLDDIDETATETLEARMKTLLAKETARIAAKRQVQKKAGEKHSLLGFAADIAAVLTEEADLRCWSTLPSSFQVARLPLDEEAKPVDIVFHGRYNEVVDTLSLGRLSAGPGEKVLVIVRSVGNRVTCVKGGAG